MVWITLSWRSWLIRSRSSTIGEALDLLMQARVLDGDPCMEREHLDERLVILGEFGRTELVREVEVADRLGADGDRHAKEAVHRRVVRREPVAVSDDADVRDAKEPVRADDETQQAAPMGQVADAGALSPRRCRW